MNSGRLPLPVRFGASLATNLMVWLEREGSRDRDERRLFARIRACTRISPFGLGCALPYTQDLPAEWVIVCHPSCLG